MAITEVRIRPTVGVARVGSFAGTRRPTERATPADVIAYGQLRRIPFEVCAEDSVVDVVLVAEDRRRMRFLLETPSGQLVTPAWTRSLGGAFVATDQVSYYRIPLPLPTAPGRPSHAGDWSVVLTYGGGRGQRHSPDVAPPVEVDPPRGALPRRRYSVAVHAWSDVSFTASARPDGCQPGAAVNLVAAVTRAGAPTTDDVSVWAEITRPNGATIALPFVAAGGEFTASFAASSAGDYSIRVRAWGTTSRGTAYRRERTLSVGVRRG